ncbi:LANO_0C00892g1_1 [Lachancea nothofagi CBS 11611]|uniref:LANO_0C00892g1_1 n=1 Tax=Lachancea nothofagi CBS 11611 TaxID=1266666 RepID=A0A1G4J3F9_9SACH|nr:LANO_0C00892g1_1 [Lachancea nothofagi CBS 11611]
MESEFSRGGHESSDELDFLRHSLASSHSISSQVTRQPEMKDSFSDNDEEENERQSPRFDAEIPRFDAEIPRLSVSMTPWRKKPTTTHDALDLENTFLQSKGGTEPPSLPIDLASPLNSRPHTRSSQFSDGCISSAPTATVSASSSNEVEQLQRQLMTCKLRLRVLTELLKELNYSRDAYATEDSSRNQIYEKLIKTLPVQDNSGEISVELNGLRQNLEEKNKEIIELKQELISTKNEYNTVLDDVNSYLEHSDVIAGNIDQLLVMFSEKLTLSPEEKDALEKARSISNNFVDVKMNALSSTIVKYLDHFIVSKAKEVHDDPSVNATETSLDMTQHLDPRLEGAIESMHEEYRAFLGGLKDKMKQCAQTESVLGEKLLKQTQLLDAFAQLYQAQEINDARDDFSALKMDDINGNLDSPSHGTPNCSTSAHKQEFDDIGLKVTGIKDQTFLADKKEFGDVNGIDTIAVGELDELRRRDKNDWMAEKQDLTHQLSLASSDVEQLKAKVRELQSEISALQSDSESALAELEKTLKRAVRKSGLYISENRDMQDHIHSIEQELAKLLEQNKQLQKNANHSRKEYVELQTEFQKLRNHLLLHLNKVFDIFDKILQRHSINQAKSKLKHLEELNTSDHYRATHIKLESLYVFVESAINSVVEEHAKMLLREKEKRSSRVFTQENDGHGANLRIELLERKWVAERERRKLDADAAEYRISQLEDENKLLRQRLRNSFQNNG